MSSSDRPSVTRRGFLVTMAAAGAAAGAFTLSAGPADAASRADSSREAASSQMISPGAQDAPTVVLVHGAFADSSSWNGVVARLHAQGYPVVAVANPLRGLKTDSAYLSAALAGISGPIVLVGHSYGGGLITNAATGHDNVVALVYVAAFAPDEGETIGALVDRFPGSTLGPTLSPPVALPDGGSEVSIQQDKFWQQFAADLPEADARLGAATQRPIALAAFSDPTGAPAWRSVPSRFVYGDQDKNIPPALQAFMAERAGSRETVVVEGASHVVMISHPDAVAEMIHRSAQAHAAGTRDHA
jgi:pimeloyl-ACP methyl ester carboxylesterase